MASQRPAGINDQLDLTRARASRPITGDGHLWPPLPKSHADRVLKYVRGNERDTERDADILNEAAISVQWIKRKTVATQSPAHRKKALMNAAKKIDAAIKSIDDLPIPMQHPGLAEVQDPVSHAELRMLHQLRDRINEQAAKITVKRSGGKQSGPGGGRIEAAQKRAAADCALAIWLKWRSDEPTLSRNGPYYKLAKLLFKIATGKDGDVEDACAAQWHARDTVTSRTFEMFQMVIDETKLFEDTD